jgi:4-hydroxy-tetrahydrodipicolinate reductase
MKIGVAGCTGRMGQILVKEILAMPGIFLSGGTTRDLAYAPEGLAILQDAEDLFAVSDIVIDFTAPEASVHHAKVAGRLGKPLVIGTTGLSDAQMADIKAAAKSAPILVSANMSLGIALLSQTVRKFAETLGPDFAIEILEAHHNRKVDAPSGTALALGRAAAEGRGLNFASCAVYDRHGQTGARKTDDIGFSVIRGGDIVGEHTVYFIGAGERLELTHRATDRALFARGALKAAQWLKTQGAGLYGLKDFLQV